MSEPKISIIIPIYNVEKYLAECLDSCINQTLKDIEIICVDDASPDNSIKILEEYQQKDSRIKIIRHEKNRNLGGARNTGLANATGEYIWFVDSDDYIDTKACQILYDAIKDFDVDILCFSALQFVDSNKNRKFVYDKYFHQGVKINKIYFPKTNWKEINLMHFNVSACMYLTKKSIVQKFKFREGAFFEDTDFTPILFASVDSFCYIPCTAYFYRITNNSITKSEMTQKKLEDLIKMLESLEEFVIKNSLDKQHFAFRQLIGEIYGVTQTSLSNPDIQPFNFDELIALQKKYRHSLNTYKKTLYPPKYSLKRFVGKVLRRFL